MPVVIFILFLCAGIALRARALQDPDTGWHIAAGDLIREAGALPASDPWSHTAGGADWFNISWAYDVALSLVHGAGGLPAVALVSILLYALAVALVAAMAQKSAGSLIAALPVAVLSGALMLPGMLARPQGATFLFIIAVYWALRFSGPRVQWFVPLLMIPWAAIHGGFIAGFTVIGAFGLEALAARDFPRVLRLGAVGALSAAALLVNPYGAGVIDGALLTMTSAMRSVIQEWRPTNAGDLMPMLFLAAAFLVSALFDRRIPLADKILACFWLAAGLSSARMMQIAGILAAPYLARGVALRLAEAPFAPALARRDRDYAKDLARPAVRWAGLGLAAGLAVLPFAPPAQRALAGAAPFAAFPEDSAPAAAADFLAARYPGLVLFNDYDFGGYLVYRLRGAPPVFVDGRADTAYPRETLEDAIRIGYMKETAAAAPREQEEWEALVEKYALEGFLTRPETRLAAELSRRAGWAKVYEDADALLYVRADLVNP